MPYIPDLSLSVSGDTQNPEKRIIFENFNTTLTMEVVVRRDERQCTEFTTYFQVITRCGVMNTLYPYTIIKE